MKTVNKIFENTQDKNKLLLKKSKISEILEKKEESISIEIPFENNILQLNLERKKNTNNGKLYSTKNGKTGARELNNRNETYYINDIIYNGFAILGSDRVHFTINNINNNRSFLIDKIINEEYEMKEIFDDKDINFDCTVVDVLDKKNDTNIEEKQTKNAIITITMIYDIDYHTWTSSKGSGRNAGFAQDEEELEFWVFLINLDNENALNNGLNKGINYPNQVNFGIFVNILYSIHIWKTPDPMSNFLNSDQSQLNSLRITWNNDPPITIEDFDRDYVHLLTTNTDSDVVGIAYRVDFCDRYLGYNYAISGLLYTSNQKWNQLVIPHELGHNMNSYHTHSCNWQADDYHNGGPLDNCYSTEGDCSASTEPLPSSSNPTGTLMSYCNTFGAGLANTTVGRYHTVVCNQAFVPAINRAIANGCFANEGCIGDFGCTDPVACNFDPDAVCDDNSCKYSGCSDQNACNYDPTIGQDCIDNSLCLFNCGCTDTSACNFDPDADYDDETCEYLSCTGCTQPSACNYKPSATEDDGSCVFPGCTESSACNYDPSAGCSDGSCKKYSFLGSCTNTNFILVLVGLVILILVIISTTSSNSRSQKKRNNINIIKDLNEINDKIKDLSKKLKNI